MPVQLSGSLLMSGSITATGTITAQGGVSSAGAQYISDTSNAISFTSTASLYTDGGLRVSKNSYVSGTAYFNNVVVYGTSSIEYITSSNLNISDNIITVNTFTPSIRFGGLAVFDSGSTGLTGSMLWDSEKDRWIYSNPSGSTYDGGMMISGPRNTSGLGNELGTTACAVMIGQGADHITSSGIFSYGNATCFYGTTVISGSGTVCTTMANASCIGIGTTIPAGRLDIQNGNAHMNLYYQTGTSAGWDVSSYFTGGNTGTEISFNLGYPGATTDVVIKRGSDGRLQFNTNATERLRITPTGIACFACQVCAPQGIFINGASSLQAQFGQNDNATGTQTSAIDIISRNAANTSGFTLRLQNCATICAAQFNYNGIAALSILCNGNVGIGTSSPAYFLDVTAGTAGNFATPAARISTSTGGAGGATILQINHTANSVSGLQIAQYGATPGNYTSIINTENSYMLFGTNNTERMRIRSGGEISFIPTSWNYSNPSTVYRNMDMGGAGWLYRDGSDAYLTSNTYYNSSGQWIAKYTYTEGVGIMAIAGGNFTFSSTPGSVTAGTAYTPVPKVLISHTGLTCFACTVSIGAASTSAEANLFLGAQGTGEGGQLVLQKGTSCNCATHLDNYQNQFRIISGTDTASNSVQFMIDHSQSFIGIGRTTAFSVFGDSNGIIQYTAGTIYAAASNNEALGLSRIGTDGAVALFRRSTTTVGSICVTASATSFNTSSDYRLKTNLRDFSGICLVNSIKAYDFQWKVNCSRMYGFLAHELQEVLPYVVSGIKDGEDMQSLDYSKLTPVLVKAIQEQQCKIKTLESCLGIN